MTTLRLFPVLLMATSALLGVKVLSLVLEGGASAPTGIGVAMAQEAGPAGEQATAAEAPADAAAETSDGASDGAADGGDGQSAEGNAAEGEGALPAGLEVGSSIAERKVLESLSDRRRELDRREKQAELRQQLLEQTEDRLKQKADEIAQIEASIKALREEQERKKKEELQALVVMYEAMKPKDAARIFDRLDLDILLKVAREMKPRKMADVMARMSPEVSERLTVALVTGRKPRDEEAEAPAADALPKIMGN